MILSVWYSGAWRYGRTWNEAARIIHDVFEDLDVEHAKEDARFACVDSWFCFSE